MSAPPPSPESRTARLLELGAAGAWALAIIAIGLPHAIWRHFHVDEMQVAYNAALWGAHGLDSYANYAAPFMVPLAWIAGLLDTSAAMLLAMRTAFFALFLFILVAIALAQPYFRSRAGKLAVLAGATLFHPLWQHGFEIRHDIFLVAGSIVLYGLAQQIAGRRRAAPWAMAAAGAAAAAMQLSALKGFLYAVPFGGAVLIAALQLRWPEPWRRRLEPLAWFAGGAAVTAAACLALLAATGHLDEYAAVLGGFLRPGEQPYEFSATGELVRVALDSPIVYGAALLFLVLVAASAVRLRGRIPARTALTAGFLLWQLAALAINPVPFPYNFIHLAPFAFLAALDVASRIRIDAAPARAVAVATALAAAALLFGRAWLHDPYMTRTNEAQLSYIRAAELMTDPASDTVLDGVGMVLSRRPPDRDWMLHSLWIADYRAGRRTSFTSMMLERPSPVVIGNYRWGWLPARDLDVLHQRYIRLYPELYVLGSAPTGPSGRFSIHKGGRYIIRPRDRSAPSVDGQPVAGPRELTAGEHRYDGAGPGGLLVHWLGPTLDEPPAVLPLDPPGRMFTNE